jgi:hypothetical protein
MYIKHFENIIERWSGWLFVLVEKFQAACDLCDTVLGNLSNWNGISSVYMEFVIRNWKYTHATCATKSSVINNHMFRKDQVIHDETLRLKAINENDLKAAKCPECYYRSNLGFQMKKHAFRSHGRKVKLIRTDNRIRGRWIFERLQLWKTS